ncbi:MAG: hypothetical protein AB1333_03055 [Patescibacteria group bacterium]
MEEKAFLVGTHRAMFHAGEPAEITEVVFSTPEGLKPRACYRVRFENGDEDLIPISESHHFEIISESDVKSEKIPEVIH